VTNVVDLTESIIAREMQKQYDELGELLYIEAVCGGCGHQLIHPIVDFVIRAERGQVIPCPSCGAVAPPAAKSRKFRRAMFRMLARGTKR
jgi:hypothetical protein